MLDESLTLARSVDQPWLRVRALVPILLRLPAAQKTTVAVEVLETIRSIPHDWHRGRALMLRGARFAGWSRKRSCCGSGFKRWGAVCVALAVGLPVNAYRMGLRLEVLHAAPLVMDESWLRASLLSSLAGHLSASEQRVSALAEVAPYADGHAGLGAAEHRAEPAGRRRPIILHEALTAARHIEDEGGRAETLAALLDDLTDDQRTPALREARQAARAIEDAALRAAVLIDLLPAAAANAQGELLQETLTAIGSIEDVDSRAEALSRLMAYRAVEERARAVRAVLDLWRRD